jgi:hypothetical protein
MEAQVEISDRESGYLGFSSSENRTQTQRLTVVGWLWKSSTGKARYTPEHANIWARMIHRHLTLPHRLCLLTDWDSSAPGADFDPLIEPVPLWSDWRELRNPAWPENRPNCYVRLKAFSEEFGKILLHHEGHEGHEGLNIVPRFVSIDLDCVVLKNLDPLFDRDEDFLIYRRHLEQIPQDEVNVYQASMWMMKAGARKKVWEDFKGLASVRAADGYLGTDQAWMRHSLGDGESGWTREDGVYGWPNICRDRRYKAKPPEDARIIFFYGGEKPWHFASTERPRCHACGADVRVKPPWELNFNRHGATDDYQWIPRNYC